ncbi:MAG: RsmG family class I SAM-dependent methyltransferase [Ilumatobacter sp.]
MSPPRNDTPSPSAPFDPALLDVLTESQRLGFLGDRAVVDAAAHSRRFAGALEDVSGRVIDIGAGGGLPGLVVAHDRPDLELLLVDRRAKRTDFLQRSIRRLGWSDRIRVEAADVRQLIQRGITGDAVIARGFGPPMETVGFAHQLTVPNGRIVISEPPASDRWDDTELGRMGIVRMNHDDDGVVVFGVARPTS